MNTRGKYNKALHRTAIPLYPIAAGELSQWTSFAFKMLAFPVQMMPRCWNGQRGKDGCC